MAIPPIHRASTTSSTLLIRAKRSAAIRVAVFGALICIGLWTLPRVVATEPKPTTQPTERAPDQAELLKRFVDELVEIKPGQGKFPKDFSMGTAEGPPAERPVHRVTLSEPFAIAKYETPQNLYESVAGENPSRWKGKRNSVEMLTWTETRDFCKKLTAHLQEAKLIGEDLEVRLPTEAEWEYCCRAGTTTAYSFGDGARNPTDQELKASILDAYAWHTGNAAGNDPPVGALKPNPWGLYDMHGYLREFVLDDWNEDYSHAPTDGRAMISDDVEIANVVVRGGSWKDGYEQLRSAARRPFERAAKDDAVGFRCVCAKRSRPAKSATREP